MYYVSSLGLQIGEESVTMHTINTLITMSEAKTYLRDKPGPQIDLLIQFLCNLNTEGVYYVGSLSLEGEQCLRKMLTCI